MEKISKIIKLQFIAAREVPKEVLVQCQLPYLHGNVLLDAKINALPWSTVAGVDEDSNISIKSVQDKTDSGILFTNTLQFTQELSADGIGTALAKGITFSDYQKIMFRCIHEQGIQSILLPEGANSSKTDDPSSSLIRTYKVEAKQLYPIYMGFVK